MGMAGSPGQSDQAHALASQFFQDASTVQFGTQVQAHLARAAAQAELQQNALLDLRQAAFQVFQWLDQQLWRQAQAQKALGQQLREPASEQLLRRAKVRHQQALVAEWRIGLQVQLAAIRQQAQVHLVTTQLQVQDRAHGGLFRG